MLAAKIPPQQFPRYRGMLEELRENVRTQSGRDPHLVPEYGSEVYQARELLLKKLERFAGPGSTPGSAGAEKYPIS
jgi:hypothetical protein